MTEKRPDTIKRASLLALVLLLLLIAWEVIATTYHHLDVAEEEDWQGALAKLKEERQVEDQPILFAPRWADPLGRFYFGEWVDLKMATLSDVDRYSVVWQVSLRDARHPWLKGQTPKQVWNFGPVELARFEQKPVKVLFDFYEQLSVATARKSSGQVCKRVGKKLLCDSRRGQGWNHVGPSLAEVDFLPYRCIYAHPVEKEKLEISYSGVPMGQTLVGYTGIDDYGSRRKAKSAVLLEVYVNGKSLGRVDHQNEWDWRRFTFDTKAYAGKKADIRFAISTKKSWARPFCFRAEVRK
jgi:hypothetical protein